MLVERRPDRKMTVVSTSGTGQRLATLNVGAPQRMAYRPEAFLVTLACAARVVSSLPTFTDDFLCFQYMRRRCSK